MNELLEIVKENNELLKEIKALLLQIKERDYLTEFSINVAANIFCALLQNNQELYDILKQYFKIK